MAEAAYGPVERGVFDLSKLPIQWDKIDQVTINKALRNLERSAQTQQKELQNISTDSKDDGPSSSVSAR
jgi:hypothetical protein